MNGEPQPQIMTTTTLPAKPLVPSLASLVAGSKTLAEIQSILGIDEKEAVSRLEAAELLDKVATSSSTVVTTPPAAEAPATTTATPAADAGPPPDAPKPDGEFTRKRGRSAGGRPPAATSTATPAATAGVVSSATPSTVPTHVPPAQMTTITLPYPPLPQETIELTDEVAMALGRLAALAMNSHVAVEKILDNALVVLRAQKRLP